MASAPKIHRKLKADKFDDMMIKMQANKRRAYNQAYDMGINLVLQLKKKYE